MCQQHPQFLTAYRLHMHRTTKPRPHHLRYAARIVAVRLVDLRLQHRLHVPRLNADHRQSCFGESAEQPLRQRSSFQPNSLEVVGEVLQHRQQRFRFARHLYFPHLRQFCSIAVAIASAMTVETATSFTKSTTALAWTKACESAAGTAASRSITVRAALRVTQRDGLPITHGGP